MIDIKSEHYKLTDKEKKVLEDLIHNRLNRPVHIKTAFINSNRVYVEFEALDNHFNLVPGTFSLDLLEFYKRVKQW